MRRHDQGYSSESRIVRKLPRWNAVRLADENSLEQLEALRRSIVDDPANANPAHATGRSIFLYAPAAQRKLDALAHAVTMKLAERRRAQA
jgi:hypothetical protein